MLADVDALNYTHVIKLCYAEPMAKKPGPRPGPRPWQRIKPGSPTRHFSARIAEDDYLAISKAADREGISVSQYVRHAAVGTAVADPETRETVFSAAFEVSAHNPAQTTIVIPGPMLPRPD